MYAPSMQAKALLLTAALSLVSGCTQVSEYTGEVDCGAGTDELDAWMLLETSLTSAEPQGWFGISPQQGASDTWVAAEIDDAELDGQELTFEVDFDGNEGRWEATLEMDGDGGWEGEVEVGTTDCDVTLDLEA